MSISRAGRLRAIVIGGALVAALAIPAVVNADTTEVQPILPPGSNGATVSIDSVTVTGKVVATVDLTFVCQPFEVFDWETGQTIESTQGSIEDGDVTILQAQGKTVAAGSASVFGPLAVCDGSTANHLSIPVTATTTPWKKGAAAAGAFVRIADAATFDSSDFASTGPVSLRLR
jgi:hypothetical protein